MSAIVPLRWVKESTQEERRVKHNTARQEIVALLHRAKLSRQASLIGKCCANQATLYCECGNELRMVRQHCRRSLCPDCQRNKAFKISKEVEGSLSIMRENAPGLRVLFLTLTIFSCDAHNLKKELTGLPKSFSKLIRAPELRPYLIGCLRVTEIGYNCNTKMFHPHLHALLVVRASYYSKGYISQPRFLALWQKATGRSDITQLKVRPVKPDMKKNTSLATEAAEMVRYMLKPIQPEKWTAESLVTLSQAIHKRRQYELLGDFKFARKLLPPYKPACYCPSCRSNPSAETL